MEPFYASSSWQHVRSEPTVKLSINGYLGGDKFCFGQAAMPQVWMSTPKKKSHPAVLTNLCSQIALHIYQPLKLIWCRLDIQAHHVHWGTSYYFRVNNLITNIVITTDQSCACYFMSAVPYMSLRSLASLHTRSTSCKAWTRSDKCDLECLPHSCGPLWSYDLVAAQNETTKVYDFQVVSSTDIGIDRWSWELAINSDNVLCSSQPPHWLLITSCSGLGNSHFDLAVESFGDSVDMEWHEGVSCSIGYIDVADINVQIGSMQKPSVAKDSELQQLQNKAV
ncbi:hypothetical protein SELMODRAFT_425613 [Selaginella moellendorffii]|uniref:Uncharacterized protein n=1 Tax=Selaginella moellendorffii TaxID=88036 RepID=D8STP1_SELML|nr:hypothetical protein SELMODRAFT_425613 [Selaginella moellendorffii]